MLGQYITAAFFHKIKIPLAQVLLASQYLNKFIFTPINVGEPNVILPLL